MNSPPNTEGEVLPTEHGTASEQEPAGRGSNGAMATWIEIIATVTLALSAVAIAWSGYQANRWHGEQAIAFSHANASRLESTRASSLANAQTEIDVATFTQWVDAYARHQTQLADFYYKRFRKEFAPAVAAWVATRPLRNANAPLTPFVMPNYRLQATAQAQRLQVAAEAASAQASRDIQRADDYVLGVVLFSAALFFVGISTRLGSPRQRATVLGVGCAVLLGTLAWTATFPVSIST